MKLNDHNHNPNCPQSWAHGGDMSTATRNEYLEKFLAFVGPQYDWKSSDWQHKYSYGLDDRWDRMINGKRFTIADHENREAWRKEYSFAIPTDEALEVIAKRGPIIEMGAGSGYWSMLLADRGVDVVAFDNKSWGLEHAKWFPVQHGGPEVVQDHSDRTLFLCWPPYDEPFAAECLKAYRGDAVVFIGESEGGCTADDEFFRLLSAEWEDVGAVRIPQWSGIHDFVSIHKRKA